MAAGKRARIRSRVFAPQEAASSLSQMGRGEGAGVSTTDGTRVRDGGAADAAAVEGEARTVVVVVVVVVVFAIWSGWEGV